MKASEFGQSLLSDIRERNKAEQKRAEKRAKRDAWKQVGIKVATGVAEDLLAQRHQNLLYKEGIMANKLKIDTVFNEASGFADIVKEAESFSGGQDAYLRNELDASVDAYLKSQYASGTYNQTQFNSLKTTLVDGYFDKYKESFTTRADAHKKFLASGDKDAYLANIKSMKGDGTIGSSITQLIKKIPGVSTLTGSMNSDLHKANQDILARTDKLSQYQEAYRQTRNSELAKYVTDNLPSDLGTAAPTISKPYAVKRKNVFGEEYEDRVVDVMTTDTKGNTNVYQAQITGNGLVAYGGSQRGAVDDFSTRASKLTEAEIRPGKMALQTLSTDQANLLSEMRTKLLKDRGIFATNKTAYNNAIKEMDHNLAAVVTTSGRYAVSQGWGTAEEGRAVAMQVLKNSLSGEEPSLEAFALGENVPFKTMFAISSAVDKKEVPLSNKGIALLAGDLDSLYISYRDMTPTQRKELEEKLVSEEFFKNKLESETFKNTFIAIKSATDRKLDIKDYSSVKAMLGAVVDMDVKQASKIIEKPKVEEKPKESTAKLTFKKPPTLKEAAAILDKKLTQEERSKLVYQNVRYNSFIKAEKELDRVKNLNRTNLTDKQYNALLTKAEKEYDKTYQKYKYYYVDTDRLTLLPNF